MSKRQRRREEKRRRHERNRERPLGHSLMTGAGVTVGATMLIGGVAQAATFTVGTTADPGTATDCTDPANTDCTLRQAITDANSDPGSTITFRSGLSGTITLDSALPIINGPTTITGPGATQIAVSGNDASRPLDIAPSAGDDVRISGLTITHGFTTDRGGALRSKYADLTLSDVVISDSEAGFGGGGVAAYEGGSLTIVNSTITGNVADRGAGVETTGASGTSAMIRNSTISGNSGADYGGGVYFDYSSPAAFENSTAYGNSASGSGGGVYHVGAYDGAPGLIVTGSTITHNSAYRGGGLACYGATAGGGSHQLTEPILRNTIVFGNTADADEDGNDVSCDFNNEPGNAGTVPAAFSLIGSVDPGTHLNQTGPNILGQDPQLGPLADNGGPTQTQKPALSSPVIDQGSAFGLGSDQRGQGRPFEIPSIPNAAGGDGSDIGAIELQASDLPSNAFTAKVKGKKLIVSVSAAGTVAVADAKAPLAATAKKKKRRLMLKASSGSGGPPTITVALRLTKLAKQTLRRKGKLTAKSRVTFTPNRGLGRTQALKLKIKGKKKKKAK